MLLTLAVNSLRSLIERGDSPMDMMEVPRFAHSELSLHGLHLPTGLLKGWDLRRIERLRDEADKAACPCLLLVEDDPQPLVAKTDAPVDKALERMGRVLHVAHRLGCSGVGMRVVSQIKKTDEEVFDLLISRLKQVVQQAERLEMNLLLIPEAGITETPDQMTTLIRKVGGFRIGSFPDFEAACGTGDPVTYLRSLTPYASAVNASTVKFDKSGKHTGYDFEACVEAVTSVGYEGTVALEYRGTEDPVEAILAARALIEKVTDDASS